MYNLSVRLLPPDNATREGVMVVLEDCDEDALMDLLNDHEPVRSGSRVYDVEKVLELEIKANDEGIYVSGTGTIKACVLNGEGSFAHRTCRGPVWRRPHTTSNFCRFRDESVQSSLEKIIRPNKDLKLRDYKILYSKHKNEVLSLDVVPSWQ